MHVVLVLALLAFLWYAHTSLPWPSSGRLAPLPPVQSALAEPIVGWNSRGYHFTPLAHYDIKARVLHRADYMVDRFSTVCPMDLALGWGAMSDPQIYGPIWISQDARFYYWFAPSSSRISLKEITCSSANTHMIPGSPDVWNQLYWVRAGDVIHFTGDLVEIHGPNGADWRSSLTREDSGPGACEIVWVEKLETVGR